MKPILKWQYDQLIKELVLLQGHDSDPTCPCKTEGENCVRKHLLTIEALAQETEPIEDAEDKQTKLTELADQARMLRDIEEHTLCGKEGEFPYPINEWSRKWRKEFEQYSLDCSVQGGNQMPEKYDRCVSDVQRKIESGELPSGSSPHAICTASIKGKIGNPEPPTGAEVVVTVLIDPDKWVDLEAEGVSEADIQKRIENAVSRMDTDAIKAIGAPVFDVLDAELRKYY